MAIRYQCNYGNAGVQVNKEGLSRVQSCISDITTELDDIKQFDAEPLSRLNSLCSTPAWHRPRPPLESITVGCDAIHASHAAKNIGIWFDEFLSMDKQVKAVCKSAFFHLGNIAKTRGNHRLKSAFDMQSELFPGRP